MTESTELATLPGQVPTLGKPPTMLEKMQPQTFEELTRFATIVAKANWAPQSYRAEVPRSPSGAKIGRPEDQPFDADKILIGMMQGMELGLPALMSLQSIAVINGIPSIYGDAMLAVVERSGLLEDFKEIPIYKTGTTEIIGYKTYAKRKGRVSPIETKFDTDDAQRAGLLNKSGPWTQYRSRMLQFRSRSLCLRDGFSDVLKGLTSVEEAQDIQIVSNEPLAPKPLPKTVKGKLDTFAGVQKPQEPTDAQFEDVGATEVQTAASGAESGKETAIAYKDVPDIVQQAFNKGTYQLYITWLVDRLNEAEGDVALAQEIADFQMDRINAVHGSSEKAAGIIDKIAADFGFSRMEPSE